MSLRDRLKRKPEPEAAVAADDLTAASLAARLDASDGDASGFDETPVFQMPVRAANATPATTTSGSSMYSVRVNAPELSPLDQLKVDIHRRLIERLDMEALEEVEDQRELHAQIREAVLGFLQEEQTPLSQSERDEIVEQIIYEATGLGPIEPLFRDPSISDILINGPRDIYVERGGRLAHVSTTFRNDAHLLAVIDRIVSRVGRRVDESSPMVDARLPDGSRVNAIIPPLALDGPVLSIRRFGSSLGVEQLIAHGAMDARMALLLAGCVQAKLNILISGGTGSGKTTLLNALSSFIPATERIITIEDAAELQLQQNHVVRLETRPPNVEGRGEVTARDLIRNALRMRPNRIIVGEVRAAEVLDMLQAMNTGHEGSLATIHANTPRDALARLETMIMMAGTQLPLRAMREQIASAIDVIVQVARLSDGSRRVVSITEMAGEKEEVIALSEIYAFDRKGVQDGRVIGSFRPTGIRPRFADRLALSGVRLPASLFDESIEPEEIHPPTPSTGGDQERVPEWNALSQNLVGLDAPAMRTQRDAETIRDLQRRLAEQEEKAEAAQAQADLSRNIAAIAKHELSETLRQLDNAKHHLAVRGDAAEPAPSLADDEREELDELRTRTASTTTALLGFVESADELVAAAAASPEATEPAHAFQERLDWLLRECGVEPIVSQGRKVDDDEHEVVRSVVVADRPEGEIVEEVQRGFRVDGHVARRAQVVVARAD